MQEIIWCGLRRLNSEVNAKNIPTERNKRRLAKKRKIQPAPALGKLSAEQIQRAVDSVSKRNIND